MTEAVFADTNGEKGPDAVINAAKPTKPAGVVTSAAVVCSLKQCMRFYGHLLLQWALILGKAAEAIERLRIEKAA
jgi:hypothetical protein